MSKKAKLSTHEKVWDKDETRHIFSHFQYYDDEVCVHISCNVILISLNIHPTISATNVAKYICIRYLIHF